MHTKQNSNECASKRTNEQTDEPMKERTNEKKMTNIRHGIGNTRKCLFSFAFIHRWLHVIYDRLSCFQCILLASIACMFMYRSLWLHFATNDNAFETVYKCDACSGKIYGKFNCWHCISEKFKTQKKNSPESTKRKTNEPHLCPRTEKETDCHIVT